MTIVVARDGQELGDFDKAAFEAKIAAGEILPTDHYWAEGMAEWEQVSEYAPPASVMARTVKMQADEFVPEPAPPKSSVLSSIKRLFSRS